MLSLPCPQAHPQQRSADTTGLDAYLGGEPLPTQSFTSSNSATVASDSTVWVVTGGNDSNTGLGMTHTSQYDRATGDLVGTGLHTYEECTSSITIADQPDAPLDAIPVRCGDHTGHLDLFNGNIPDFAL